MVPFVEEPKAPIPPWLVSFGDMMTLILTFFILLVSLSTQRDYGLLASGLGSFVVALKSHGMPGMLSESEKAAVFDDFRRRFNLPPESEAERRARHEQASELELLRAAAARALEPTRQLFQPRVAEFEVASSEPVAASLRYLARLADELRPAAGQLLVLEGHADGDTALAFARASAVREHLIREHDFEAERVEARAWWVETEPVGAATRCVDARLVASRR